MEFRNSFTWKYSGETRNFEKKLNFKYTYFA